MIYTDEMSPSENEYKILSKHYNIMLANDKADINEIKKKMQKQREFLSTLDDFENKQKILDTLDSNIADLDSIINTYDGYNESLHVNRLKRPQNHIARHTSALDVENGAYSPYRSIDEMRAHGQLNDTPNFSPSLPNSERDNNENSINTPNNANNANNSDNLPNNTDNGRGENNATIPNNIENETGTNSDTSNNNTNNAVDNNTNSDDSNNTNNENNTDINNPSLNMPEPNTPTQKIFKRNSPMQSNNLFNVAKRFNVNLQNFFGFKNRKKEPNNAQNNNCHYNLKTQTAQFENRHHCSPHQIALDNQIDIIRLFLLYLMLRPNCRISGKIAKLANTQFDIFLQVKASCEWY